MRFIKSDTSALSSSFIVLFPMFHTILERALLILDAIPAPFEFIDLVALKKLWSPLGLPNMLIEFCLLRVLTPKGFSDIFILFGLINMDWFSKLKLLERLVSTGLSSWFATWNGLNWRLFSKLSGVENLLELALFFLSASLFLNYSVYLCYSLCITFMTSSGSSSCFSNTSSINSFCYF